MNNTTRYLRNVWSSHVPWLRPARRVSTCAHSALASASPCKRNKYAAVFTLSRAKSLPIWALYHGPAEGHVGKWYITMRTAICCREKKLWWASPAAIFQNTATPSLCISPRRYRHDFSNIPKFKFRFSINLATVWLPLFDFGMLKFRDLGDIILPVFNDK